MDTKKLLLIINDIIGSENKYNFQQSLNTILDYLKQNNSEEVNNSRDKLYESLQEMPAANYVGIELKSLGEVGILGLFDHSVHDKVEEILNGPSYEITQKLETFINERNTRLDQLKAIKTALEQIGMSEDAEERGICLVAFAFPEKFNSLSNLSKATSDIDLFLGSLARISPEDAKNYEIYSVGNGCIEFYIKTTLELAQLIFKALEVIVVVDGAIQIYNRHKETSSCFSRDGKTAAEKINKEELDKKKSDAIEKFVESMNITGTPTEINGTKAELQGHLKRIVKYFEEGVIIEVKTPQTEKPREANEDDDKATKDQLKKQLSIYQKQQDFLELNKMIYQIQKSETCLNLPEQDTDNE